MGRRSDPPAVQKAKGYPGRRKAQTDAELKAKASGPSAEDQLLASMDFAGLRPPPRFARKEFKEERDVWMAVVPRLKQTLRASAEFQAPLVAYCDAVARYNRSVLELRRKGYTVSVKTVSGDSMMRVNPSEKVRQQALAEILALSDRFGFTPRDNFALLIDQRRVLEAGAGQSPQGNLGLNDEPAPGQTPAAAADPVGGMDRFDSPPPGSLPN
jgi:P27 family predicted phage terminase small subunit